jgi:hypothetical protein
MTATYAIVIALGLIVFLLGLLVAGLLRSHAEILRKLDSLGAGVDAGDHAHGQEHRLTLAPTQNAVGEAPDIAGVNPDGEPVVVSATVGSDPLLIAFLSTSCSSCIVFWENLDRPTQIFGDRRHRILITTLGESEESPTRAQSLARGEADVVMSTQAWQDYEVPGAPYFVVVDPREGVIGQGSASTFESLEQFLVDSTNDRLWDRARRLGRRVDADDAQMMDEELRRAGIEPGDKSLYPEPGDIEDGN